MPMPDPWSITQEFINNLNAQAEKNRYYNQQGTMALNESMINRQDADLLYGRKLAGDEHDFNQQLLRDEAQREFTHNENYLRSTYGSGGAGSKSRFAQPTTQPGGPPPYQSPLGTTSSTQPQRRTGGAPGAHDAYSYYKSKGVHPMVAAGLVGNFDAESSWNPGAVGDAGKSYGFGQWNGSRRTGLIAFAQSRGHAEPTPEDMLDYPFHEAESGSDPGARRALQLAEQASTPEEAAKWIRMYYERPSEDPNTMQEERRASVARQVYDAGGQGGGTQTQPATTQRRYPNGVEMPDDGTMPSEAPVPFEQETSGSIADMDHVWTDDELKQYLSADEIAAVKQSGEVIGPPRIYSESAYEQLPETIRQQLMPVFKSEQYGPSEYLYIRDSQAEMTEDGIDPGGEPTAQVTVAPPVEIKTTNPVDPKGSENVKEVNGIWFTRTAPGERWVRMD